MSAPECNNKNNDNNNNSSKIRTSVNVDSSDIVELPPVREEKQSSQKPSLLQNIVQVYYEYCGNTSIHGVQYLAQERPTKEKVFWLCMFVISIYCCTDLIENIYTKWTETPVIVSFSEKSTPVWEIPFPAVTICSETKRAFNTEGTTFGEFYHKLMKHMAENTVYQPRNLTRRQLREFRTMLQICDPQLFDEGLPLVSAKKIDYFAVLDKMVPPFERYFFLCKWFSYMGSCEGLFTRTYTEEGVCFTFNGLNVTDLYREGTYQHSRLQNVTTSPVFWNRTMKWSLEQGYDVQSGIKTYPARVLGAGSRAGLLIALQSFKQEIDYVCRGPVQGFKVLLHSPDDVPVVSKQFVRIPMGKEIQVTVKPNMITTSEGIATYAPIRRQCFLTSERYLRFFKTYTQTNCEVECLANFTLSHCGCVKFSMPRAVYTPVCAEDKIDCYYKAEDELLLREFTEGLKGSTFNHRGSTQCNCLPACTSLVYNTEISQSNFELEQLLEADGDTEFMEENNGSMMSRLSIYFKESQFITSKRSELYGITDFLANCGGIFGLFMGFSILSMVEAVYHFSLRLWSNMHATDQQ